MRIWDLHPGYLDRKRLLGEHRELHGLFNVVYLGKKGYSRHPETLRWAQHKYSVMAHDPALYRELGPAVAHGRYVSDFPGLALLLVHALRKPLQPGRVHNALAHMWGYLEQAGQPPADKHAMIAALQQGVSEQDLRYLMHSTALSGFNSECP